jgi:hypothetical protein
LSILRIVPEICYRYYGNGYVYTKINDDVFDFFKTIEKLIELMDTKMLIMNT